MDPENHASDDEKQWRRLVEIHNHAKAVFICAEEFDCKMHEFMQPNLELKNSLEHIMRAQAARLGINKEASNDIHQYVHQSLDKAIGHTYRAFFDAADWISVSIRDRIQKSLKSFSVDCISAVLPEFYSQISPRVDTICCDIAKIRADKDVSKTADLLKEVDRYRQSIDELIKMLTQIRCSITTMSNWRRRKYLSRIGEWFCCCVLGGIITAAVIKWMNF